MASWTHESQTSGTRPNLPSAVSFIVRAVQYSPRKITCETPVTRGEMCVKHKAGQTRVKCRQTRSTREAHLHDVEPTRTEGKRV